LEVTKGWLYSIDDSAGGEKELGAVGLGLGLKGPCRVILFNPFITERTKRNVSSVFFSC
jgi:hypothetical protein